MKVLLCGSVGFAACLLLAPALAQSPPPVPAPAAPQTPPPVAPAAEYFYNDNGKPTGPVTLDEIRRKLASGDIKPDTLIWKAGMPNWVAAKTLPELTATSEPQAPKPAPVAASGSCAGGRTYLSDNFTQNPVNNPDYSIEEGKLKGKAKPGDSNWFLYGRVLHLDKYEACVVAQLPNKFQDPAATVAGLVFAAASIDDFYALMISADSQVSIQHWHDAKFEPAVTWKEFDAVKIQPPAKNILRAVVHGNAVTAYVNGQKFADYTFQPPNGTRVGLLFHSEQAQRDTWKFIDFKVTDTP